MTDLIQHVKECFKKADARQSKIDSYILGMDGMTGKKTRHFYNNLCSMPNARYLEIGVWKGSSLCAAMCGNTMKCLAIENWSEFGGPKDEFLNNYNKYKGANDAQFLEGDCFALDVGSIGSFNIYMYDGNHEEISHFKALNHYNSALDDQFIYIIDDWNWDYVRKGTLAAIEANHLNILYQNEIFTNNKVHPPWGVPGGAGKDGDWHNGICVFVLSKH
jgi:hypothetical protein